MDKKCIRPGGFLAEVEKENKERDDALALELKDVFGEVIRQIDAMRATGAGSMYQGPFVLGTKYGENQVVERGGVLYVSKINDNTTIPPSTESWKVLLQSDYGYYTGG